jgi:hypothetical protein
VGLRIGGVAEIAFDAERTGIAAHDLDQILGRDVFRQDFEVGRLRRRAVLMGAVGIIRCAGTCVLNGAGGLRCGALSEEGLGGKGQGEGSNEE